MKIRFQTPGLVLMLAAGLCACSGGDDGRLIPGSDPRFRQLESPEDDGECEAKSDCEHSCVHGCVANNAGPITCPSEPEPLPDVLEGASCECIATRCKWD